MTWSTSHISWFHYLDEFERYRTSARESVVRVDARAAVLARVGWALVAIQGGRQLRQTSIQTFHLLTFLLVVKFSFTDKGLLTLQH